MNAMNSRAGIQTRSRVIACAVAIGLCLGFAGAFVLSSAAPVLAVPQKTFSTPEKAAEALIGAAERYDVPALQEILGPDGVDLVITEDPVQDKNQCAAFAAEAREQTRIIRDP